MRHFDAKRNDPFASKMILTFALGGAAKVDGVLGASVVATHAIGAMTVPFGAVILYCDVLQGAVLGTDSATYTGVRYSELAVGYEQAVEQGLENVGFEECLAAAKFIIITLHTLFNKADNLAEALTGAVNLAIGVLRGVQTETGQVDVGLGHLEREECVQLQSLFAQVLAEMLIRKTCLVSAGAGCEYIGWFAFDADRAQKLRYQLGY